MHQEYSYVQATTSISLPLSESRIATAKVSCQNIEISHSIPRWDMKMIFLMTDLRMPITTSPFLPLVNIYVLFNTIALFQYRSYNILYDMIVLMLVSTYQPIYVQGCDYQENMVLSFIFYMYLNGWQTFVKLYFSKEISRCR